MRQVDYYKQEYCRTTSPRYLSSRYERAPRYEQAPDYERDGDPFSDPFSRLPVNNRVRIAKILVALLFSLLLVWACFPLVSRLADPLQQNFDHFSFFDWWENGDTPTAEGALPLQNQDRFNVPVAVSDIQDTGFLRLVNKDHSFDDAEIQQLLVGYQDTWLRNEAMQATNALFEAAREQGFGEGIVVSGYRDYSSQELIYNQAEDKSYVQPPGHSEHHTGLAVDVWLDDSTTEKSPLNGTPMTSLGSTTKSEATPEERWLMEHSWKEGMILRYPEDKRANTGISYEPWHYRYVGFPHAWYSKQSDMCLEEYLEFLNVGGGYQVNLSSTNYYVFYQKPEDGVVYVPESLDYEVSSDGMGGYIVTAWE